MPPTRNPIPDTRNPEKLRRAIFQLARDDTAAHIRAHKRRIRQVVAQSATSAPSADSFPLTFDQIRAAFRDSAPFLDPDALAAGITWSFATAAAIESLDLREQGESFQSAPSAPSADEFLPFRESTWQRNAQRFALKKLVDPRTFEAWLDAIDLAEADGLIPDYYGAQQQAYAASFTLVREADDLILQHIDALVGRAVAGEISPADFMFDIDDLYRSFGLREQEGWYSELVLNNALNRSLQEGRDSVGHDIDARGNLTPAQWVWGYEWIHTSVEHPRPSHMAMHAHRAPVEDPVWQTFAPPPIAHGCQCERHTIGRTRAEQMGLIDRRDFPVPSVNASQLRASGLNDRDVKRYAGQSAASLNRELPGDAFPRTVYDIPQRPMINPSAWKTAA